VGGDGSFAFSSPQVGDFNLSTTAGAASTSFTGLTPGLYSIVESATAGWQATSATCSNGDDPASVTVGAGETVTCAFTNTKLGSLTVVKVAENGNGAFSFTSQTLGDFTLATAGSLFRGTAQRTFTDLAPGTYDVAEQPTTGWIFVSAVCSDGSSPAAIDLSAGEEITCTFTNRPEPTALEEVDEPDQFNRMFLPMINR
jgi:plastocyanin